MKKFYIKLIKKIGDISVYLVDGRYIRDNLEIDFTNFAQHYRFPNLVPIDEWWIDENTNKDEWSFYIDHLIKEYELMSKDMDYSSALDIANRKEKQERIKAGLVISKKQKKKPVELEYKKLWKTLKTDRGDIVKVFIIDGKELRDKSGDLDAVDGFHGLVYHYIKTNEIYLEKDLSEHERNFIFIHEITEWKLMKYKGMSYKKAHQHASEVELQARHEFLKKN